MNLLHCGIYSPYFCSLLYCSYLLFLFPLLLLLLLLPGPCLLSVHGSCRPPIGCLRPRLPLIGGEAEVVWRAMASPGKKWTPGLFFIWFQTSMSSLVLFNQFCSASLNPYKRTAMSSPVRIFSHCHQPVLFRYLKPCIWVQSSLRYIHPDRCPLCLNF